MLFEQLLVNLLNHLSARKPAKVPEGLFLGHSTGPQSLPFVLTERQRAEHVVTIGKTGSGKTRFLEAMAAAIARRGEGLAFFDFHGDASLSLITRLAALPGAQERLVVLDPSHPTLSPAINVLAADGSEAGLFRKVSELSSILRQRWGVDSFGARTEELLRNSLYTLAAAGRPFGDLTNSEFRGTLTERVSHPDILTYWQERFEPLSDAMKASFREALLNKVTAFLSEPGARHLLSQPHSTVEMEEVLDQSRWLIIRLPKGRLREHAHTLGNLIFAQLQFATFGRERLRASERHLFTVICDEVQNLAENHEGLSSLISEGRKFNVSLVTASQFVQQMPADLRSPLLSAGSHVCFRLSSADSQVMAPELSLERRQQTAVELTTLARGEAVARLSGSAPTRFRVVRTPDVKPASDDDLDRLVQPIARRRDEIEDELRKQRRGSGTPGTAPPSAESEGHDGW